MPNAKTPAMARKELYGQLEFFFGRPLTPVEAKEVKRMVIAHTRLSKPAAPSTPIMRVWTCRTCRTSEVLGKKADKRRLCNNRRGGEVETTTTAAAAK